MVTLIAPVVQWLGFHPSIEVVRWRYVSHQNSNLYKYTNKALSRSVFDSRRLHSNFFFPSILLWGTLEMASDCYVLLFLMERQPRTKIACEAKIP
jgi:hypothetical protein